MARRGPARLRVRRFRRALCVARPRRGPGRAAPAVASGAAQRDAAHRAGPPRLRHRGGLPLRGRRACATRRPTSSATPTSRSTCSSRAPTIRAGLHGPRGGGRRGPLERGDLVRLHDVLLVVPSRGDRIGHRAPRRHGVPLEVPPGGGRREREVIFEEASIETGQSRAPRSSASSTAWSSRAIPTGGPCWARRETMRPPPRSSLRAFNRRYYMPENMALVVAGPVEPKSRCAAIVDRIFGRAPATGYKPIPRPRPRRSAAIVRRTVERPEQQAHLALGWQAPRSDDPSGDAVDLLATILAGTESSRLALRLRDKERLVSSVTMSYSAQMGGGIVSLRAELEAKDLERVEQHHPGGDRADPGERARPRRSASWRSSSSSRSTPSTPRPPRAWPTPTGSRRPPGRSRRSCATWTGSARSRASRSGTRRAGISRAPTTRGSPSCRSQERADASPRALVLGRAASRLLAGPPAPPSPAVSARDCPTAWRCWCARTRRRPWSGCSLMLRMGTRWETAETAGLSNLLQLMSVRGTDHARRRRRSSAPPTGWAAASMPTATLITPRSPPPRSRASGATMLDLVAEVALAAVAAGRRGPAVRDFLLRQIRNRGRQALRRRLRRLDGAGPSARNPYAWDAVGLKESVERMDRAALLAHYRRHYVPGGMVLAVSGKREDARGRRQGQAALRPAARRAPRRPRPQCASAARAPVAGGPARCRAPRRRSSWARWRPRSPIPTSRRQGGDHRAGRRAVRPFFLRAPRQAGAGLHDGSPGARTRGRRLFPRPARYGAGEQGQGRGGAA